MTILNEAAPVDEEEQTPAQKRCATVPREECERHRNCWDCSAYIPPKMGQRW